MRPCQDDLHRNEKKELSRLLEEPEDELPANRAVVIDYFFRHSAWAMFRMQKHIQRIGIPLFMTADGKRLNVERLIGGCEIRHKFTAMGISIEDEIEIISN
ncbi:MAG: hypothetical protein ACUVQ6_08090 [Dissulfurimicrobium sp.]|uniref:hypothetical protein n=1 Tax=Dissulfurimicrobium sp. TaxID=2022436 RepID=UPI00404B4301